MCGIAGILYSKYSKEQNQDLLIRMLARIAHRGPDESGVFLGQGIALGNVRLSIIDIQTGQQPMRDSEERYWIVFNGEIFNYKELKEELILKGHTFFTSSDTEVLLHAFLEYKEDCLNKLNGQFVFAIWDCEKRELFIARDRIGIRPLFFYHNNGAFLFSSEIKSILEFNEYSPQIDEKGLSEVFTFWSNLSPHTLFKDIRELSPGHFLKFKDSHLKISKYWSLNFGLQDKAISFNSALDQFGELLEDAVRIRLRADVPVAAYLSGGLDSSATTSIIKKIFPDQLQTYSIGFTDKEYDETSFQQDVSQKLGTRHNSFYCTPTDISSIFPSVIWHTEIPLTRTSPAPMFLLSKKVREQDIKVVITGEGADEMLAGYDIFKETIIRHFWSKQPNSHLRPLLLKRLYPYIPQISGMNARMLKFVYGFKLDQTENPFYSHLLRWHNTGSIKRYLNDNIIGSLNGLDHLDELSKSLPSGFNSWNNLEKAQWLESSIFLSGYLLSSQGDRMAMANSVEGRYPFLDYRIMEFCASLPSDFKMKGLNEKFILKELMSGKLPEKVLKRQKQAYRAPIISTFIHNPPEYLNDLISESSIKRNGIFCPTRVTNFFKNAKSGKVISEIDSMAITGIISTQLFSEIFIHSNKAFKPDIKLIKPKIINQQ